MRSPFNLPNLPNLPTQTTHILSNLPNLPQVSFFSDFVISVDEGLARKRNKIKF